MTVVHIAEVPESISRETVRKIIKLLDLDPSTTEGIQISPDGITVDISLSRVPIEERSKDLGSLYRGPWAYTSMAPVTTSARIPITKEGPS